MEAVQCIEKFFIAFANEDAQTMSSCYVDDIVFFDPAFDLLKGDEVKAMWAYFFSGIDNLELSFEPVIDLEDDFYTRKYTAAFTLKKNGRHIVKKATANMKVQDGKILEHSDGYSLHQFCTQAYGFPASLIGWNSFYQKKIKNKNRAALLDFMER